MTDTDRSTTGSARDGAGRRVAVRRIVVGLAIGLAVASAALLTLDGSSDDVSAAVPAQVEHQFPADHVGPVWIAFADDGETHSVHVAWGVWERSFVDMATAESHTYRFAQRLAGIAEERASVIVTVDPPVDVTFGHSPPPEDAIDINAGWQLRDEQP